MWPAGSAAKAGALAMCPRAWGRLAGQDTYSRYYNETEFNLNLIRKLNSIINNELIAGKVDGIYFYGDDIKEDTFSALEKNDLGPFMLLNPFECFTASEVFLKNSTLRKNFYSFAPGCGVALRNIQS